jgi:ABC-2 type transport system ATP-binding protein
MKTTNDNEVVIRVDHLHKRYGDKVAVDDISFEVNRGEIFGILGPNGAGKTTTVECVEGLRRADAGTIEVLGLDPAREAPLLHERIGGQLQSAGLPDKLRVGEALELFAALYADPVPPRSLAERLGLDGQWSTKWKSLSGGQQQRLSIALALIGRPEIAILDELTAGLDPQGRRDTYELVEGLRDGGVTVVLVTHMLEEAERLCDRIAVIDEGRMVAVTNTAGLVAAGGLAAQRLRFVPSEPIDVAVLTGLREVATVERHGPQMVVTGTEDVVSAVVTALARAGVTARNLRIEQPSLEDAYLSITDHTERNLR